MNSMPANHNDSTKIVLDADAKTAALREINEIYTGLKYIYDLIKEDECRVESRFNVLGVVDGRSKQLRKILGGDSDIEQTREVDLALLREANAEVHRLKELIGTQVGTEAVSHKLDSLNKIVYNWWTEENGFSYCLIKFGGPNCLAEFSPDIDRHVSRYSDTPVTDKQLLDEKITALSEIIDLTDDDAHHVIDNPDNRKWIIDALKKRFPSIKVYKIESHSINQSEKYRLSRIHANFLITDIE